MLFEEHLAKANGCYIRDLLTLVRSVEDLRVPPRTKKGFYPKTLPN